MDMMQELRPGGMIATIIYSAIGIILFGISFIIIQKICPFSLRKEIEEDQNIALAIIIGSVFIAMAIIIQAAIRG